ncbi:MAG TPA: GNAT family N-acetyltransferase [Ktedonobacteraceae bacterium]|nr:GNAT family N-acetyltransferase [Ktedonobacteraceae bacterium]
MNTLRYLEERDYIPITQVVDSWWGRPVSGLLPRLFFQHFQPTSFVIEEQGEIRGFLIGFQSQTRPEKAYIHFVGIHPSARGQGCGRSLYERFFATVRELGCTEVSSITSPINKGSIAFHISMGFEILPGDAEEEDVAVLTNYDGQSISRVRFRKVLA